MTGYTSFPRRLLRVIMFFVALFVCWGDLLYADPGGLEKGNILIIASYNPDTHRMSSFISKFEQTIVQKNLPYSILIEDMGCKGIDEAPQWRERMKQIVDRYRDSDLKAVILLGQEAWASFLSVGSFSDKIPFFGCFASINGINLREIEEKTLPSGWEPVSVDMVKLASSEGLAGGYLNMYDVDRNLKLVRSLYPWVRNIAFISDNTYGGISLQSLIKQEMKTKHSDLGLILIDGRDGEEQAAVQIEQLPVNTVLLVGTWRVGADGQYMLYNSLENLLARRPELPVFSLSGSGMGNVALGGYIPKYGDGAVGIAQQIADHYTQGGGVIHFEVSAGEYRFDSRKLKKFEIPDYRLPKDSVIIDDMKAQLEKYEYYLMVIFIVLILLGVFIGFLSYFYYRTKKLQQKLEKREVELIHAKEKAEESDRLKTAFLANMSHEIRTPLNAIVGFSDLLCSGEVSDEERQEYCGVISQNTSLLLTLINDILDISRLETGRTQFVFRDEDLYSVCEQAIFTTAYNRKEGVTCVFKPERGSFSLQTDAQRLTQVLINLMTNAYKFTEHGQVTLDYEIQEDQNRVLFSVSDTGCGIPTELQEHVFERFSKLNEFKQGTGLGLAICKQIIKNLGGEIWVDSTYTEGARFVFTHVIRR